MKSVFGCLGFLLWLCSRSLVCAQCSTCLEGKCYDTGECILGCVAGYLDKYCDKTCPSNCLNASCHTDRSTGATTCSNGCIPGYCRSKCSVPCPPGCVTCNRQCTYCNVTQCAEGDCSQTCDPNFEKCDRESGRCIRCRRGYYGNNCDKKCTKCFTEAQDFGFQCQSGCDRCRSQESCSPGSYGDNCDKTCSRNCGSSNSDQDKPCNKATGECSKGCQSGYYGRTCNYTCNELCVSSRCNQHNGTCEDGCISGYKTKHGVCERYSDEETPSVLPVVLPIVLVLIGVCVCVLVIVIRRHRRQRKYKKRKQTTELEEVTTPLQTDTDHQTNDTELEEVTTPLQTDTHNQTNDSQDTVTKPVLNQNNQDTKWKSVNSQQPSSDSSDAELLPEERLQINRLRERCTQEIHMETKDMIRVSAVDTVIQKLKDGQNWITVTGNAGDGKTTLAYLVLKELSKQMSVYNIYLPEEYKLLLRIKGDRVILFDDRFGAFTADAVLIKNWLSVIKDMLNSQHTRIIFVSRKNVLKEAQNYLGRLKETIFNPACVVDLSTMKIIDERKNILDYYLKVEKLKVDATVKKRVAELDIAHGFPHCCMMYSKLKKRNKTIDIEEFFISPLKFLDMTTAVLYEENCKELFDLMIKNEGTFDAYSVTDDAQRRNLLKVEKEQEGSYITVWKNGVCKFAHPSIYESVLSVICDTDPLFCVKYASLSVIRQKMNLTSDVKHKIPTKINVKPVPAVLDALAERFRPEILDGDYTLFGHGFCENKDFCDKLLDCCVSSDTSVCNKEPIKQYINKAGKDGQTMLWTAVKGGINSAVQGLVQHGADVNIPDERRMTPLLYLCGRETLNVDTIKLMVTTGKADCKVSNKRGITPLHYLCVRKAIDIETIKLVVTEGQGDINKGDEYGSTPLHYLCKHERVDLGSIHMISVNGKGDINKVDDFRITPLHCLCRRKDEFTKIVSLVTEMKGDINQADQYGNTPLHYLCRRDKIIDVSQLKQIPGADMDKQNEHGHSALDYLQEREKTKKGLLPPTKTMKEKLPWTEGIVDRSVADLVMCKLKRGEKWIPVLGPAMTLSAERVHKDLKVEDGDRELTNMAESGKRPGQFSKFYGTCSNPIPLPSSPSTLTTPRYWETNSRLLWKEEALYPLLEMGISDERNLDAGLFVSHLPRSWSVSVQDNCHRPRLCIQVFSEERQVGDCISLSPTPGTQINFIFGLVLDVGRGRLGLIDVERGKLLHKFDVKFQKEVVPMFSVNPHDDFCEIRMRLVSGREISVTDSKIKLIQEALFD